jgi:hypothetical protein
MGLIMYIVVVISQSMSWRYDAVEPVNYHEMWLENYQNVVTGAMFDGYVMSS